MKEEVIKLTEDASNLIEDFENYMFLNAKEKYIGTKPILDQNKETIELINESIDSIDLESTKTNLENIINAINDVKEQLEGEDDSDDEEIINNAAPIVDEDLFKEQAIDNTIESMNNSFDNINFNEEFIDPFNQELIENKENEETIPVEETPQITDDTQSTNNEENIITEGPTSDELDIAAIDDFLANNTFDFE